MTRSYDQNYWLTDVQSPALQLHFRRDAVGNIDRLGTAPGAATPLEQYDYDNLYRLESARDDQELLVEGYSYDETGNRLSKQLPGGTEPYDYPVDSHRLVSAGGKARTYDATGNTLTDADGSKQYTYGDNNRLMTYADPVNSGSYHYNGRGERVRKDISTGFTQSSTVFMYDEAGRLLGEYNPVNGSARREYVYADSDPIAVIVGQDRYYIHPDHLGTPRAVVDSAGTRRWEWSFQSNPFGEQLPDGDPDNTGSTFTLNLRFPGQYYDVESGLHYNYFRDYEPGTGRYVQSDPIGLYGGTSTYGYAAQNPLSIFDLFGLFDCETYQIGPKELVYAKIYIERQKVDSFRTVRTYPRAGIGLGISDGKRHRLRLQPEFVELWLVRVTKYKSQHMLLERFVQEYSVICQFRYRDRCGRIQEWGSVRRYRERSFDITEVSEVFEESVVEKIVKLFSL